MAFIAMPRRRRRRRPPVSGQYSPPTTPLDLIRADLVGAGLALAFGAGTGPAAGEPGSGAGMSAAECAAVAQDLRNVYARLGAVRLGG